MQYNPEEINEILNIYKAESEEIIQEFNDGFMELEKNPKDKTPLKRLFQLMHSLKGASRMLEINSVQDISHKIEDILSFWKKDETEIKTDCFPIIYNACDLINELVDKSVKQKSNYTDDNVVNFIQQLDEYIVKNNMISASKSVEKEKNNTLEHSKEIDVEAFILELIFVSDKDNFEDNLEETLLVIKEDLKQLAEIFSDTDYNYIKEQIASLLTLINSDEIKTIDIGVIKNKINDLKDNIRKLHGGININENIISKKNAAENEPQPKQEVKNEPEQELNTKFNYILANLQKIKYEKNFLKEVIETLKNIEKTAVDNRIPVILNKVVQILNLFIKKDGIIDNDCYMVILQSIYFVKRISLKEKEDNPNNFDILLKRLKVVEDMFNTEEIQTAADELTVHEKGSILSQENYSDLKKNINSFDIQEIKTLRVDTKKLDNLISQAGELLINGIKTQEHIIELAKINSKLTKLGSSGKKILNYFKYLEKRVFFDLEQDETLNNFYKKTQSFLVDNDKTINEINNDFIELYNIISEDDNKLHQNAAEIETIAKNIRVLPLATLFHSFPRMIRDIAKENDKKINFIVSGSDTTVDKKIIEEIKMPLIHILRNSISHGIESPKDRLKNKKAETGIVKLEAKQVENYVIISVEDDGYGIDLEKVKQIALTKGLLSEEETEVMSSEQLMKLIFLPGFSTEESVNDISGRGIGLDVVKTKITNLNGDILIDSVLNKGCKVTIRIPLSMSAIRTFILIVNNQKYAIPVSSIKYVKQIKKEEIFNKNGVSSVIFDGHTIPVYFLSDVFNEKNNPADESQFTMIILENQEFQAAFIPDGLLGAQEVFQKKLISPILKIKNISGFTTLSTGEICLIINPYELIRNTVSQIYLQSSGLKKLT